MKITLKNLTKRFRSRDGKGITVAVNNFNVEIPDGKFASLLGPSGCGKSTCLNLISGLLEPTEGQVFFGEDDVTSLPAELRGIGMVFQNYALYPHLSVEKNILFPLENLKGKDKLSKQDMHNRVLEAAKLVQIEELLDRKPNELSGGQQQRVAIARAMVKYPKVLLLDEPLSNLDARLRLQTREEIRRIQKKIGVTTVFVTHDQEDAMSISDMIIVMKQGVIQQIGSPQDVYDHPINLFVAKFLGNPAINVFEGKVLNHKLYIGEDYIMDKNVDDQDVYVGIRPEAFKYVGKGHLNCKLDRISTMGRDTSVIVHNDNCISDKDIRAIIASDVANKIDLDAKTISFDLNTDKVYVFSKKDELTI